MIYLDPYLHLSGDNIQGVSGSPVSWEHFFHSLMLYHENLRRDLPNLDTTQYRHPPLRGITQRELEGLTSFFQLLTTIITWVQHSFSTFESRLLSCAMNDFYFRSFFPRVRTLAWPCASTPSGPRWW